jgi:multidrug efflux pump
MLTLYTTPVVYLYMDRFSLWWARRHRGGNGDRVPAIPGPLQPVGD